MLANRSMVLHAIQANAIGKDQYRHLGRIKVDRVWLRREWANPQVLGFNFGLLRGYLSDAYSVDQDISGNSVQKFPALRTQKNADGTVEAVLPPVITVPRVRPIAASHVARAPNFPGGAEGHRVISVLEQAIDRRFRDKIAFLVGEARGQFPRRQLRRVQCQIDDPLTHLVRDAMRSPSTPITWSGLLWLPSRRPRANSHPRVGKRLELVEREPGLGNQRRAAPGIRVRVEKTKRGS